jgi:tetratricopeptide (TPR) repeat protein
MFLKERIAHKRAVSAEKEQARLRHKAEAKEIKAQQVAEFLKEMLRGAREEVAKGRDASILLEILDKTARRVGTELTNHPWVQEDLYTTIGRVYADLGRYQEAELVMGHALATTRNALARREEFEDVQPSLPLALGSLAEVLLAEGKMSEAEALYREALAATRALPDAQPSEISAGLNNLAVALNLQSKWAEAEKLYRESLALTSDTDRAGRETIKPNLGYVQLYGESLALTPNIDRAGTATIKANLACVLGNQGKHAEAESMAREALAIRRSLAPNDPNLDIWVYALALTLTRQGKLDDAEQVYNRWLSPPTAPLAQSALLLQRRGQLLAQRCKWKEAAADLSRALELHPANSLVWHCLAAVLIADDRLQAYRELCQKGIERFGQAIDPYGSETITRDCLILPPAGLDLVRIAKLADMAVSVPSNYVWITSSQLAKGLAEYRQAHFTAAAEWTQRVLSRVPTTPGDPERNLQAAMILSMAKYHLQQTNDARVTLAKGVEMEQKLPNIESRDLGPAWLEWIFAKALMHEAKELIEGEMPGSVVQSPGPNPDRPGAVLGSEPKHAITNNNPRLK